VKNGDPYTYQATSLELGRANIADVTQDLRYLNSNMLLYPNREDTEDKINVFKEILANNGLTIADLVAGESYGSLQAINTQYVAAMSSSNRVVVEEGIGDIDVNLGMQLLAEYL
jgi:hypothetical protein